jgi:hypothetical protein
MASRPWDGHERRKSVSDDHDTLIEIKTKLFSNGEKLDKFIEAANKRLDGHDKDIRWSNSIIYGAVGAFVLIEFVIKVIK